MAITVPTAGAPILDTWGADVANALNKLLPVSLTADLATNSASATDIPELEIPVVSGRVYVLQLFGGYFVTATNQGLQLAFSGPGASASALAARIWGNGGPTTEGRYRTTSGAIVGQTTTDATGYREWWAYMYYAANASGTLKLQFARGGTSNAPGVTLSAGSGGLWTEIA